jgi:hypothetical protein
MSKSAGSSQLVTVTQANPRMNTPRASTATNNNAITAKASPPLRSHPNLQATRVAKRIAPTQPGAIKLAEQYGERLVCVRYRHDPTGRHRYTTVELVVASSLVKPRSERQLRPKKLQVVALRLGGTENALRKVLLAHGGVWNSEARLWYLARTTAQALGLLNRVV